MRGGYFAGSDYVPYTPGALSHSTATSLQEFKRQETVKCPKCGNIVPKRDFCVFCNQNLMTIEAVKKKPAMKKHCPICNRAHDIDAGKCSCGYDFKSKRQKPERKVKRPLFDSSFTDEVFFKTLREQFDKKDYVKWSQEYIPKTFKSKMERFYSDSGDMAFSRLAVKDESIYYFAHKRERSPRLMLIFSENPKRSNFRLYRGDVLILLKVKNNIKKINKTFSLKYATKKRTPGIYYLSLGEPAKAKNSIETLIDKYSDSISNPLTGNYEFYEMDLNRYR